MLIIWCQMDNNNSCGSRGREGPASHPNSFNFLVFGKIGQNRMFGAPLEGWRPISEKSWIRH